MRPVQADDNRGEEKTGNQLRLKQDDELHQRHVVDREPHGHERQRQDGDAIGQEERAIVGQAIHDWRVDIVREARRGDEQQRIDSAHDGRERSHDQQRSGNGREHVRRHHRAGEIARREVRKQRAHRQPDHHDRRADDRLKDERHADRIPRRRQIAHREKTRNLERCGGQGQTERGAKRQQLAPPVEPAKQTWIDRRELMRQTVEASQVAEQIRHRAHHARDHDNALQQVDPGAAMEAAEQRVDGRARQNQGDPGPLGPAEHGVDDDAARLVLRDQKDRVRHADERGGDRTRGGTIPAREVIRDRQRARLPQLRRDEHDRHNPSEPRARPDPRETDARHVMEPDRADEGAGADLGRGEGRAADDRAERAPGDDEVGGSAGAAITQISQAGNGREVAHEYDQQHIRQRWGRRQRQHTEKQSNGEFFSVALFLRVIPLSPCAPFPLSRYAPLPIIAATRSPHPGKVRRDEHARKHEPAIEVPRQW